MIIVCLFAVAALLYKAGLISTLPSFITGAHEKLDFPNIPNSLSGLQHRFREDWNAQSFAGRPQTELRNPFGPNPQQKYIQEMDFFDNQYYQDNYKLHLKTARIDNQDWRLDLTTNGVLNNYPQQPHLPEDNIRRISEFSQLNIPNQNKDFFSYTGLNNECY